jgi:endonuclease/exonuclease/phosphatase family metal-dependent hydrolase
VREAWLELLLFIAAAGATLAGHGLPDPGLSGFELRARDANVVRVVTWNVGGAIDGDAHALPESQLDHVAQVLAALDADVIALQELASVRQAETLAERLGPEWSGRSSERGFALLARNAVFRDAGELGTGGLGTGDRSLGAILSVRGHDLAVIDVHAHAFDARDRNRTLGEATTELLEVTGVDARILLGDLNLDVDLDKKRDLFSNRAHLDVETYNYIGGLLQDAARGRGSTAEPDRRLDYVFVSPAATVEAAGPWKKRRSGTMDHDPVVADLRL